VDVVAEGVERQAQIALLHELGCHKFQGFAIAEPMAASEFSTWMRARTPLPTSVTPSLNA
jgi:EAL domain-containing protein (putative c-di-GMP-specific phosphodiesterase class I)